MVPLLIGLSCGALVFLAIAPGASPARPTNLARIYARMGVVPRSTPRAGPGRPLIRRLPLGALVATLRPWVGPQYQAKIARLLRISRLERTTTFNDVLAMKTGAAMACLFYAGLILLKRPDPLLAPFLVSLGGLGFLAPDAWLRRKARRRQEQIQRELPAVLSALAVALEAGLQLMPAIAEATRGRTGPLAEELKGAVDLYEKGETAGPTLDGLAAALEIPELTVALTGLLQAFAKGSGHVVRTVRTQAAEAWQKRRRRAEALAQTASIKLFLPIAVLALPGFLIFMMGPALLEVLGYLMR